MNDVEFEAVVATQGTWLHARGGPTETALAKEARRARASEAALQEEADAAAKSFLTAQSQRDAERAEKERLQDELGRIQSTIGAMVETEIENSGLRGEIARLRDDVAALRGLKPEQLVPDCPNCGLLIGPHDHAPGCEYAR